MESIHKMYRNDQNCNHFIIRIAVQNNRMTFSLIHCNSHGPIFRQKTKLDLPLNSHRSLAYEKVKHAARSHLTLTITDAPSVQTCLKFCRMSLKSTIAAFTSAAVLVLGMVSQTKKSSFIFTHWRRNGGSPGACAPQEATQFTQISAKNAPKHIIFTPSSHLSPQMPHYIKILATPLSFPLSHSERK